MLLPNHNPIDKLADYAWKTEYVSGLCLDLELE
jgi:hypothetical protein